MRRLAAIPAWLALVIPPTGMAGDTGLVMETQPGLPVAVSNNAVALTATPEGMRLFSFFGLESGRSWRDISKRGWVLDPGQQQWRRASPLPGATPRLAAAAVALGNTIWLFGGYTVAGDGAEVSTPEVYRIHAATGRAEHVSDMPVPVDDMLVLAYRDRYLYLVSGWHDLGNVNLVQVLDTETLQWTQATPWPGAPVFGHAGGIRGANMLVCDGVRIEYPSDGSARKFLPSDECWIGEIGDEDHRRIAWRPVPAHPGLPRYRMAAGADANGRIVFAGGSANPYNYDGIGYNGVPSEPQAMIFSFELASGTWSEGPVWPGASMDHRNLPYHDGWFYVVGGMLQGQQLTDRVLRFRLGDPETGDSR